MSFPRISQFQLEEDLMRRIGVCTAVLVLVACLVPLAPAQDKDVDVGWVHAFTVKPGMTKQFEEGRKRHMDWHRKQNDSWSWQLWEVMTGEATGSYYSITFGHSWKDLDAWEQKLGDTDTVDSNANMMPYLGGETSSLWMVMRDWSHPSSMTENPKMAEVNHFLLKPGTEEDFEDAVKKITEAIVKSDWPAHYTWFQLQDGGEGPHYVLSVEMKGWADLAEPNPSFGAMLEKAMGKHDAEALRHALDHTIQREWTETIRYRPELSYQPAAK
jgi:hypothetical protein